MSALPTLSNCASRKVSLALSSALLTKYSPPLPRPAGCCDALALEVGDSLHRAALDQVRADDQLGRPVRHRIERAGRDHPDVEPAIPGRPERGDDRDAADIDRALVEEGDRLGTGLDAVELDVEPVFLEQPARLGDIGGGELGDRHIGDAHRLRRVERLQRRRLRQGGRDPGEAEEQGGTGAAPAGKSKRHPQILPRRRLGAAFPLIPDKLLRPARKVSSTARRAQLVDLIRPPSRGHR